MADHVFGIDLGTTYSAIAYVNEYGQPEVVRNTEGFETTPSVVYFESASNVVVGREAKNGLLAYPDETVSLIKREMGTSSSREYFRQEFTPEAISALILKELVGYAQDATGVSTRRVVITVPAYFGLTEKEATRQAGVIAGLEVEGIITEPVAAALSAGMRGQEDKTLLVYDLGGGTFDCTVMSITSSGVDVLVTDGDRLLGGADWDSALFDLVAEKFHAQAGLDVNPSEDEDFTQRLTTEVEACKMTLTAREKAKVRCTLGETVEMVEVTREEFEARTRHLLDQTLDIVARALTSAEAKSAGVTYDEVLLVGGSARMPMVERALGERFGWTLTRTEFDLAVAKGAALYGQGAVLAEESADVPSGSGPSGAEPVTKRFLIPGHQEAKSISNVLPKGIGVKVVRDGAGGRVEHYITFLAHAQDSLPLTIEETFSTYGDDATALQVQIFEQGGDAESEAVADNREITPAQGATFTGLPNLPAGSPLEFSLGIDAEGLATLSAFEPRSDQRLRLTVSMSVMQAEDVERATALVAGITRGA